MLLYLCASGLTEGKNMFRFYAAEVISFDEVKMTVWLVVFLTLKLADL